MYRQLKKAPTFFSVLWSNLKCAFCKERECKVRYYPKRMKEEYHGGSRSVTRCKKERGKWS